MKVIRGDVVESVHRASIAVVDARGQMVASFGDPSLVSFMRSSAKPMQAVPLIESGAADRFGFGEKELAIADGSHSAEPRHVELVESMLNAIGLGPDSLKCGRHAPMGKEAAVAVGEKFDSRHHNCSGKHAGMLAVCVHKGWDIPSYQAPDHPLQQEILRVASQETGVPANKIQFAVDGCGVPTFAVSVHAAARVYARLVDPSAIQGPRRETLERIRDAMRKQPFFVAGTERLDTDLMVAAKGNLIVKAGAEAYFCAGLVKEKIGLAIKIEDGNMRAMPAAMVGTLKELGAADATFLAATKNQWDEPVKNVAGRVVGRYESTIKLLHSPPRKIAA